MKSRLPLSFALVLALSACANAPTVSSTPPAVATACPKDVAPGA